MIKIGLIGAGRWGKNHARVYSNLNKEKSCKFVGIADKNPKAKYIADEYKVKFYTDYNKLLEKVDAVSVAVPTNLHYEVVKDCLNAGKHILVEKPITLDSAQAKELMELANKNGLILTVGYLFRFNEGVLKLKNMVKNIGDVQYITARYIHSNKPPRKDCGVVFNFAVHLIDILNFILDEKPKKVYCKKMNYMSPEREDVAFIVFDYGKFIAELEVSWFHPLKQRDIWIIGSKEKIYADLYNQTITRYPIEISYEGNKVGEEQKTVLEFKEPLLEEIKHFCSLVEKNNKGELRIPEDRSVPVGEEAYLTTKLCELCLKSAETGKEIDLGNE